MSLGNRNAVVTSDQGGLTTCTFTNSQLSVTAAPASVNGRVTNAFGNGISGATVGLTDLSTGQTRYALTNSFGYYTFDNCQTEDFYLLTVEAKRYKFSNNSMTFTLQDNLFNMDFTSNQ